MKKRRKLLLFGGALVLVVVLARPTWDLYWHVPGRLDFYLHHRQYETIVAKVRTTPPQFDDGKFGYVKVNGIEAAFVRRVDGSFAVGITTANWGHFGHAGYVYSESIPRTVTWDPYTNVDAPGGPWMLEKQVAPHWWVVSCYLD